MRLDPSTLSLIVGTILPLIVALVTKATAPNAIKIAVNIVVNAIAFVLANAVNDAGVVVLSWTALGLFVQQVAVSIAAYLGVGKPLDISAKLLPSSGLG